MQYTTNYDIGDRKRGQGINEDSVAVTVFEEGHRDGYRGLTRPADLADDTDEDVSEEAAADDADGGEDETAETDTPTAVYEPPADDEAADDTDGASADAVAAAVESVDDGVTESDEADAETGDEETAEDDESAESDADDPETDETARPANRSAGVFVLADGAGGHDAGDVASYIATTVISEHLAPVAINTVRSHPEGFDVDIDPSVLPDTLGEEDVQTGLQNAIVDAHREIIRYASESGTQSYTTVVAGVYADGYLHVGWVGDSRAYLVNDANEEIIPLTKDHAVVEEMADDGEIDDVEAHVHPNGNEITRALGGSGYEDPDRATVEVDTHSVRLFAEDTVLVTSDGLVDAQTDAPDLYNEYIAADRSEEAADRVRDAVVTDEEIRDVLLAADSMDSAAKEYVTLANERGGKDNISVLLFEDGTLPPTPSGGLPVRAADPDIDVSERDTVIINDS